MIRLIYPPPLPKNNLLKHQLNSIRERVKSRSSVGSRHVSYDDLRSSAFRGNALRSLETKTDIFNYIRKRVGLETG